ncbi:hypothetical protein BBP40_012187 [Aspergillus hancockii]|nr:hypothetical protein BBP40_012187 [Aspergillus hancockii]
MTTSSLLATLTPFVTECMKNHDPSHNPQHVHRVVSLAQKILARELTRDPTKPYSPEVVHLSALLHDIGDRKYLSQVAAISTSIRPNAQSEAIDPSRLVYHVLVSHGADEELAERIQMIVSHVSYTTERSNPERVRQLIDGGYPELAIVQDADRLDAIGAVGIGRCFTFLGAKGKDFCGEAGWVMGNAIDHFGDKLEKLEGMMKTETGREMAQLRTARLREFRGWWEDEMNVVA